MQLQDRQMKGINKYAPFKIYAWLTDCISQKNSTQIDNAKDLNLAIQKNEAIEWNEKANTTQIFILLNA